MKYDYVIVGGGSGGATLAARLTENPNVTVCLLEAGGEGRGILTRLPVGAVAMLPGWGPIANWAYSTVPQPGLNGRIGYQPRGKALGGSSAINAMLYVRGHKADYDGWADLGCDGWDWDSCLPYFLRSEGHEDGASDLHGGDGPLQVSHQREMRPISRAFVEAAQECQHRVRDDFNLGETEGVGHYQVTQFHDAQRRGERCSAAAAYLHPVMARPNLTVITRAQVTRILFDGKCAVGVAYTHARVDRKLEAAHEVILCGGTFNTPQLLQLSGVGRAEDITPHGIDMVHELPGVGQNLQDHLDFILGHKTQNTDTFGIGLRGGLKMAREALRWRRTGTGMLASPFAEGAAFLRSDPSLARPDIQLHFVVALVENHARRLHLGHGYSLHLCALHPHSRGTVRLASADPMTAPEIDPQYLSDTRDLDTMIRGAKLARAILQAPAMKPYDAREMYGVRDGMTDSEWADHIRARADTIYHPVGTCRMGTDADAVVDTQLRVRGLDGLRVVDASVMPTIPGGNTNAPTIMIAERAAAFMANT